MELSYCVGSFFCSIQNLLSIWQKCTAFFSKADVAFCSLKQFDTQLLLQIVYVPAYGGLGYTVLFCSIGEVQCFAYCQKAFDMIKMHVFDLFY